MYTYLPFNVYCLSNYLLFRMMDEARQTAIEQKDLDLLLYVQSKGGDNPETASLIAAMTAGKK